MKAYVVIYLFGEIIGSVGPVPYDMDVCRATAAQHTAEIHADTRDLGLYKGKRVHGTDFTVTCEMLAERPKLENPVTLP